MSSKFNGIFEARKREAEASPPESPAPPPAPPEPLPATAPMTSPSPQPRTRPQSAAAPKQRGRPSGKRSDGEHVQVTAYIQKRTHRAVKLALVKDEDGPDFSELVEELLSKWLKSRT